MSDPVQNLLKEKGIAYNNSGKDYITSCLNPDHTDTNPSFRIDKVTGVYHCFSCGWKGNLFKLFGVVTNHTSIRVVKLKQKLAKINEDTNGLDYPEGYRPFNAVFRGISSQTLKEFGAFKTDKIEELQDRIIFPLFDIRGKITAFVGRHLQSNANPRYQLYPKHCKIPLYPTKFQKIPNSIVLVEGIFDLLNVWDKGMTNTVCTFGTGGLLNDTAEKLLPYKVMGITKIFILYDGDDAGRKAAAEIQPLIEACDFIVEIIPMEEGTDPGDLAQEDVTSLIEYTK